MKKVAVLGIIAVLLLVVVTGCSSRDSGTGSLKVTVKNNGTVPVTGAKVVSESQPDGQLKVTGITTDDGIVTFDDSKVGTYRFYVSAAGFIRQEFEAILTAGHTAGIIVYMASDE